MMVQLGEIFCYGTQTHHLVLLIFEGFNKNCSLKKKTKNKKQQKKTNKSTKPVGS